MEVWIPVNIKPQKVHSDIQEWLDKYSYHAYKSIIQDRINSTYPGLSIPKALYILNLDNRVIVGIVPHEQTLGLPMMQAVKCPICHEEDTVIRQTLACNHTFHHHCIQQWFRVNNTCPLCRMHITNTY
tara:strand:+ start:4921 stop:5304 length:384 start_codon:yes stop_codon:yes gene_type:complete